MLICWNKCLANLTLAWRFKEKRSRKTAGKLFKLSEKMDGRRSIMTKTRVKWSYLKQRKKGSYGKSWSHTSWMNLKYASQNCISESPLNWSSSYHFSIIALGVLESRKRDNFVGNKDKCVQCLFNQSASMTMNAAQFPLRWRRNLRKQRCRSANRCWGYLGQGLRATKNYVNKKNSFA